MRSVSHQRHHSELELDESELFEAGSTADSPLPEEATEVVGLPLAELDSADESESDDDGIVLDSEGSSSSESEVDEVEMSLHDRISSLHSSVDPSAGAPIHAGNNLSSSHRSHVGSLKTFGSGKGKRLLGSDGDLAASMPVGSRPMRAARRQAAEPAAASSYGGFGVGSMPITIPMLQRRASGPSFTGPDEPTGPVAFVPPHLIQRTESGENDTVSLLAASQHGGSPSNDPKRERLRARNAILRQTGFIEVQQALIAPALEIMEPVKASIILTAVDGEASNQSSDSVLGSVPVPRTREAGVQGSLSASVERRVVASSLSRLLGTSK